MRLSRGKSTSDKHDEDGEKPFEPCVARDVAKANSGERGGGEVEGGEVGVHLSGLRHDHRRRCQEHHHEVGFHLGDLHAAVDPILYCELGQPAGASTLDVHCADHIPGNQSGEYQGWLLRHFISPPTDNDMLYPDIGSYNKRIV